MKASSFFWGIVIGVAASSWLSKGKLPMMSSGSSRNMMDQAKHKMMEMTFPGMDGFTSKQNQHGESHKNPAKKDRKSNHTAGKRSEYEHAQRFYSHQSRCEA